jgi:pimeloyl-ACP methyl ester carboxylesterase
MADVRDQMGMVLGRPCRYWAGGPPDGPVLLLLHGGLGDAALHWHHNFASLSGDFRLLAPDLPGFGHTPALPNPSYPAYAAWVAAFCDMVAAPRVVAVGNSMGGAIARVFAASYPAYMVKLVLVDGGRPLEAPALARRLVALPPVRMLLMGMLRPLATSDLVLRRCVADAARLTPALKGGMRRGIRRYLAAQSYMLAQPPLASGALRPRCPVLVIWGADDGLGSPAVGRALAEQIGAEAVAVIAGAGHMPMFEQPDEFGRVLRRFVQAS